MLGRSLSLLVAVSPTPMSEGTEDGMDLIVLLLSELVLVFVVLFLNGIRIPRLLLRGKVRPTEEALVFRVSFFVVLMVLCICGEVTVSLQIFGEVIVLLIRIMTVPGLEASVVRLARVTFRPLRAMGVALDVCRIIMLLDGWIRKMKILMVMVSVMVVMSVMSSTPGCFASSGRVTLIILSSELR